MITILDPDVDKTTDFVDALNIPWYGGDTTGDGAFTPGRITSFTIHNYTPPGEESVKLMVIWWDQDAPTPQQMDEACSQYWGDDDEGDTP